MSEQITKYRKDISILFSEEVSILNNAREITNVSAELRLLAINGLLQASKVGSARGQSLITLSGFLSDLPKNITPELDILEKISIQLTRELTETLLLLIRVLFYTDTLENYINQLLANQNTSFRGDDFNLLNIKELKKLQSNELFSESPKTSLMNLKYLTQNDIKRNGFIANYMGTNILIEASYLNEYQDNFNSLVENILNIINNLNKFLDIINNSIINAKNIIQNLNLE